MDANATKACTNCSPANPLEGDLVKKRRLNWHLSDSDGVELENAPCVDTIQVVDTQPGTRPAATAEGAEDSRGLDDSSSMKSADTFTVDDCGNHIPRKLKPGRLAATSSNLGSAEAQSAAEADVAEVAACGSRAERKAWISRALSSIESPSHVEAESWALDDSDDEGYKELQRELGLQTPSPAHAPADAASRAAPARGVEDAASDAEQEVESGASESDGIPARNLWGNADGVSGSAQTPLRPLVRKTTKSTVEATPATPATTASSLTPGGWTPSAAPGDYDRTSFRGTQWWRDFLLDAFVQQADRSICNVLLQRQENRKEILVELVNPGLAPEIQVLKAFFGEFPLALS